MTKLLESEIWKALLKGRGQVKPLILNLLFHSIFMDQMFFIATFVVLFGAVYILVPALCISLVHFLFSSYLAVNNALYTALYCLTLDLAEGKTEVLNGI